MMEWQSIETAPKDGSWILAFDPNILQSEMEPGGLVLVRWMLTDGPDGEMWHWGDTLEMLSPTHWMPTPAPPRPS